MYSTIRNLLLILFLSVPYCQPIYELSPIERGQQGTMGSKNADFIGELSNKSESFVSRKCHAHVTQMSR